MPEIIQNQPTTQKPTRRKKNKETHNAVERHRKEKINTGIKRIGDLLPCSQALKQSKNMILGEAFRYINELKQQNDEMLLSGGEKVQAEEIKRLRQQLEDLRKESAHYIELLKANGINFLDDPTIHWKGKQRCAKVAKITPTHLMSKGIIVYPDGNSMACSTAKISIPSNPVSHLEKQTVNAITIQPSCEVQMGASQTVGVPNGTQINEIIVSSAATSHIPLATLIPAAPKPCLAVVEQYTAVAPVAPKLPPPVNYITLQGLCPKVAVTAPLQQTQPANTASSLASSTSLTIPVRLQPVISLTSFPQTVVSNPTASDACSVFQQDELRSLSHTLPTNSTHHRTSAASSTQTTWTTLQLTGNTVQPVCQALATESSNSGPNVQQLSVCPVVANPPVQPTHLQVQTQVSMQLQTPAPTTIPVQPKPPHLYPALLPCPQAAVVTQSSVLSQTTATPQPAVLHQPSVVPQTALLTQPQAAVVAHPTILPKAAAPNQSHSYPAIQPKPQIHHGIPPTPETQPAMPSQPQPHPSVIPQAQSAIVPPLQHTVVPQPQAATLPVLQAMQVLQMNTDGTPVIGTPSPQNNPNVVILQQAGPCPAPQVIREDVTNQTPCQHIVIIQTPTVTPSPKNHQTSIVPTTTPALPNQITTSSSSCTTAAQANVTKQLVHILPRPSVQTQAPAQAPTPTQTQAPAPQTITVNGQVYVLQSVKSAEKGSAQVSQSATQIIQPTSEESSTNVALNCLGALTSLSHSIPQVSSQSNLQLHTIAPPTVQSSLAKPVSGVSASAETVLPPTVPVSSASISCGVNILPKKSSEVPVKQPKQMPSRKTRPTRRKEPKQKRSLGRLAANTGNRKTSDGIVKQAPSSATSVKLKSSTGENMNGDTNTQSETIVISVASTCNPSAVSVSSSTRITESSVCSAANRSNLTSLIDGVQASKSIEKSSEVITSSSGLVLSAVNTAVSLPQDSLVGHTSSGAVLTPDIGLQPNGSTVSGIPSSQTSTLNTSCRESKSVMNDDKTTNTPTETISPNKLSISSSTSCRPTESSASLSQNDVTLTTVSSTGNKPVISSVDSTVPRSQSVHLGTSVDPTKSGSSVSLLQSIPQVQTKPAREDNCKSDSPQMPQTRFQLPSTSSSCSGPSTSVPSNSTPPILPQESRNLNTFAKPLKQQEINMSVPSTSHIDSMTIKLAGSNTNKEPVSGAHSSGTSEDVTEAETFSAKETVLSQEVSTLENDSFESPLVTNRQSDSPVAGGSGSRGFSVASLLPAGHNITACTNTYGTFSFTSEQAEILAMAAGAILEQESPGRRSGSCSGEHSSNTTPSGWDLPKTSQIPNIKERVTSQQVKQTKQADLTVSKTPSQVSVRGPLVEVSGGGTTGVRLPLSMAYSQSQPITLTSLNVNNLIRPSSIQPYPGSPNLGQQVSVPSPGGTASLVPQSSSQVTPSCAGPGQVNEYTSLKSALMRTHVGAGISERHQKDMPKRSAQEDLVLPINKRSKPCPAASVGRIDVKATEHVQVMPGQMPSSSSTVMVRNHSDGAGPLFSSNSFMSTVLRPSEGHCTTQLTPHEQNQSTVLHLQQGHVQHGTPQPGPNVGGNLYLKHQQQQEQQRQLYQLHHHLAQPDTQIHSIQQRTLLQDQHVHKKRVVRGGQTGPPVGLQKQHHLEKNGVQQQPQHQQQHQQQQQQSQQHQQQAQQHQQQSQQHQQHQQQPQQHQPQQKPQQLPQQQQSHQQQQQQQQQQIQQQSSHTRHQHLQQQIQQQQHFGSRQEKNCEGQQAGPRAHQSSHLSQQDRQPGQDHGTMQRLMGSRTLEQQLTSQANNPVSRSSDLACTPSRQERNRLSSYSAEALIGKTSSAGDQRLGLHLQASRGSSQDQSELQGYVDSSRGKGNIAHNPQSRLPPDHSGTADIQRISECLPFKTLGGHQLSNFEVQVSRSGDMSSKSVAPVQRGPQGQAGFRIGAGPSGDGRSRGSYGAHPSAQGVQSGAGLPREQDACHQSFMQSLLAPHLPEQSGHQRATQGCPPVGVEYNCVPGVSSGDLQAKSSSPNLHLTQTAPPMHLGDNSKGHISHVSGNLHGSAVRSVLPHPPTPHSSSDTGRAQGSTRSLSAVSQRTHHIGPDQQSTKIRPGDRPRSGNLRPVNTFEPEGSLTLPSGGGVLLGRPQTGGETRRRSIVRFMAEGAQVSSENNLVSDQHLTQNFGFSFIAEGSMNPPPPINANASFIPPVTQPNASRTPALLPVEPQNTLPSFYPSYSPAAHPSLPSEIPLQYFSNQMFTSPSADKSSTAPLNNRFGSILSPPRPVGFAQASYPLLTDITPMPIANSSGITPHLSNFNLTSLFPEIATAMPPDGSSMPMSPLLSLANTSSSDSSKQSNRPAHNISHILGHDGTSTV